MRSVCQRYGSAERCGFQGRWYELSGKHQMIRERIVRFLAFPLLAWSLHQAERQNLFVYILEFLFHFCRIGVKA
jgi:hypothetical protein